jgi:DNA-binding GntR family transcriptional regulator
MTRLASPNPFEGSLSMNFTATPGNQLLRQQVYAHLRKELKSEKLKPGNTIRINQLSEELEISRTPLRDALLQLQAEGFVTFLPQRGILINELSEKEIKDIYEMLGALDSRGLLSVFSRIGSDEIQEMKAINERMLLRVKDQAYFEYFDLNTSFHNIYLNLSDNMLLLNQLNILRQRLFDFVTNGEWIKKVQVLNYQEHLKLIELIEAGNANISADFIRDVHCSINW